MYSLGDPEKRRYLKEADGSRRGNKAEHWAELCMKGTCIVLYEISPEIIFPVTEHELLHHVFVNSEDPDMQKANWCLDLIAPTWEKQLEIFAVD